MIKYFSGNQPYILFLIPVIVLLHLMLYYYFPLFDLSAIEQNNLWNLDFNLLHTGLSKMLAVLLVCLNAFIINSFFNSLDLLSRNTYLSSIIYVLIILVFPFGVYFNEVLLGHFFISVSFFKLLSIKHNEDARNKLMLSGLFLGVSTTFIPVYLFLIIVLWLGISTIRTFNFREYLMPVIALALPFPWVFLVNSNWYKHFTNFDVHTYINLDLYVTLTISLILFLMLFLSFVSIIKTRLKNSIHFKKRSLLIIIAILLLLALSFLFYFVYKTYFYFVIVVAFIPFVVPYAFLKIKYKWIPNSLFYGLLLFNILKFFLK